MARRRSSRSAFPAGVLFYPTTGARRQDRYRPLAIGRGARAGHPQRMNAPVIAVDGLTKRYGDVLAVDEIGTCQPHVDSHFEDNIDFT